MPLSNEYIDFIVDRLNLIAPVEAKKMFGGACIYRDGMVVGILDNDRLLFKVDDTNRKAYEDAGMEIFRPNPNAPGTMPYCEVPKSVQDDPELLLQWLDRSTAVAASKKSKRQKK
ncbi:MAG: TfoX/Sxy family protein [Chthonomonadales bacterium]